MVRQIFIWAGQGLTAHNAVDAPVLVTLRKQLVKELRLRHTPVVDVPDGLSVLEAIAWINARTNPGDIALALEIDASVCTDIRGATVFYVANNAERRTSAEKLLSSLIQQVPSLVNRGVQPDSATETGCLAFTRQIKIPSLVLCLGYTTNYIDRGLISQHCWDLAIGIMNGLVLCRRASNRGTSLPFPLIQIKANSQIYDEQGILVEGNACVPIDIIDHLAVDTTRLTAARLFNYGGITYIHAIDLREAGVSVGWDADTCTVLLQTLLSFRPEALSEIMGSGYLLQSDYEAFLNQVNSRALQRFPEIAQIYQEEAAIEGVNPDIAFAQALLETNFFNFSGSLESTQNNFGDLGTAGGGSESASFPSARVGGRAHIQHLKAYATQEPLVQEVVDPRFGFVTRGIAPRVEKLSRRWSAEAEYGDKIVVVLRRLYESAGLL